MTRGLLKHQREIIDFAVRRGYTFIAADPGTGKSLMAIELLERWFPLLMLGGHAIWFCPNQTSGAILAQFKTWQSHLIVRRLEGTHAQRVKQIARADWQVLVVNYEATRRLKGELISVAPEILIFDESQEIKNRRAAQTVACLQISQDLKARALRARAAGEPRRFHTICMTGTPITNNILDLWSQTNVLNPPIQASDHLLGFGAYQNFEASVSHKIPVVTRVRTKKGESKQVITYVHTFDEDRVRLVTEQMAKFTRVARKQDCLDLPPRIEQIIPVDLEPAQRKIYDDLKRDTILQLDTLESEGASGTVSANMAMTLFTRLQQVTSGFVKTDAGEEIDVADGKLAALRGMLPEITGLDGDHKVVVWCRFTHDVEKILKLCQEMKIGAVRLDGETSATAQSVCDAFQNDPAIRVLVGNVQMGVGVTLTAADYEVYYSHSVIGEHRMQSEHRVHRLGQTRKVTCYNLVAAKTVDERAFENVDEKKNVSLRTLADLRALLV